MNMVEGRYAIGLATGVFLALGIVTASGWVGFVPSNSSQPVPSQSQEGATTIATSTLYNAITTETSASGQGIPASANGTSVTHTTAGPSNPLAAVNALQAGLPSPELGAVSSQSPVSNALLAVPILLALGLGAVLYRASAKEESTSE